MHNVLKYKQYMHNKAKRLCLVAAVERHRFPTLIGIEPPHGLVLLRHTLDFESDGTSTI